MFVKYALVPLLLAALCMAGGLVLVVQQGAGPTVWSLTLLGLNSRRTEVAGGVLCIVVSQLILSIADRKIEHGEAEKSARRLGPSWASSRDRHGSPNPTGGATGRGAARNGATPKGSDGGTL